MGKDLGTYHLRVEFADGRGLIERIHTGWRYTGGTEHGSPLDATPITPTWDDEEDVIRTLIYGWTEGNCGCDCNRAVLLARAYQEPEPEETPCGETIELNRLTLIRPNMTTLAIWEKESVAQ